METLGKKVEVPEGTGKGLGPRTDAEDIAANPPEGLGDHATPDPTKNAVADWIDEVRQIPFDHATTHWSEHLKQNIERLWEKLDA